jgi:serine/threonine protein kinase
VVESRYVLSLRIGEGTSAEVFEGFLIAEDGFQRRVAIKRAKSRDWPDEERRRFVGEARVASALHHASVAAVLDYGFMDGVPFLVSELVEGLDLSALRRAANAMPEEVALVIAVDVAHALAYIHAASDHEGRPLEIVHRDLSPANVLVSWNGDVKLTDFGVARGAPRAAQTQIGTVKGTPGFMSPEQLLGAHVDSRADLFGLGCLVHWMLTGTSPVEREDHKRRVTGGATLTLPETIAEDLRAILSRALAPVRHQRTPGGAAQIAEELGEAMIKRLRRDPRSTLLSWLAKHPLAPHRLGRNLPELLTFTDSPPLPTTTVRIEERRDAGDDPTLLADDVAALKRDATPTTKRPVPKRPPK